MMKRAAPLAIIGMTLLVGLLCPQAGAREPAPAGHSTTVLLIPRLHLRAPVTFDVNRGPAWWPDVARPGGGSTTAIAAHRTTHGGPFRHLDELARGDKVYMRHGGRWHRYVVTGSRVFSAGNLHIADMRPNEWLILSACSLPNGEPTSASWRLVVYARPA